MSYMAQLQSINDHLRTSTFSGYCAGYGTSLTSVSGNTLTITPHISYKYPEETVKITATQVAVVRGNGAVEVFDSVAEAERKAALWAANDRDECLILKPVKRIASKPVDVETTDLP